MKLQLSFVILCSFLFQESEGLGLASSMASMLLPIKFKPLDLSLYGGRSRFLFQLNAHHPKSFHFHAPHPSTRVAGPSPSPSPSPSSSRVGWIHKGRLPLPAIPSNHLKGPTISPTSSPLATNKKSVPPLPSMALPPPPPNKGCVSVACTEPLTFTPPGTACACVWPIQVRLQFGISLYAFFPMVSELALQIAEAVPLDQSQVRIMGADAVDPELQKTTVVINLVPLAQPFTSAAAFSIYKKFWTKDLSINTSTFGVYDVVYVHYPGLPASPPAWPSSSATIDVQPDPGGRSGPIKPLGVDVARVRKNQSANNIIIVIVLSSLTAFVVCMGFILLVLSKCRNARETHHQGLIPQDGKQSGGGRLVTLSSASVSFNSSLMAFTGTAKLFSVEDIGRATDDLDSSRIVGEGGFGLVYGGTLDDGRKVAVKVLKRDDQQGGREFLAEVEMLGRLHHRNLVKLIGICAEEHSRCLVYELVPNGSVESHLHGVDKEVAPLDWPARMKIALGAARGLAYLHEDSSPRVIHRDFKSSNILLEHDYTPKVSDFGLARAAMDEAHKHVSTHVMGTFGYLAPEYAMTGHLLVKSDVYSYGVVLLELLTGRKPVDLSQPSGQENLVAWARPLLATREGLEMIIDPSLKSGVPLDNVARVAAIASMCVQPEVSHRPFMGEVVQALKLVCNELDETREPVSRSVSQDDFSVDVESCKQSRRLNETKVALSAVDLSSSSAAFQGRESESFRRQFNSAPLKMERKRKFWQRLRGLSRGSMSEHEYSLQL
ncbi:receptor-like serine/threonine-protein kinase ALE2 isoform X2 [Salvia miltiorrhiza]|uniref:receptor-like serine/threonine-protein kinase ALE2 isoform X2 n=1 Tax=Salvia miltiorrhiza TaxID=226208 RepID=UPI0025ABDC46|nr:receptor-like serine/threonine-protein kinase ALE2 isoform X2 [Salvia miltiorrhiza]